MSLLLAEGFQVHLSLRVLKLGFTYFWLLWLPTWYVLTYVIKVCPGTWYVV